MTWYKIYIRIWFSLSVHFSVPRRRSYGFVTRSTFVREEGVRNPLELLRGRLSPLRMDLKIINTKQEYNKLAMVGQYPPYSWLDIDTLESRFFKPPVEKKKWNRTTRHRGFEELGFYFGLAVWLYIDRIWNNVKMFQVDFCGSWFHCKVLNILTLLSRHFYDVISIVYSHIVNISQTISVREVALQSLKKVSFIISGKKQMSLWRSGHLMGCLSWVDRLDS